MSSRDEERAIAAGAEWLEEAQHDPGTGRTWLRTIDGRLDIEYEKAARNVLAAALAAGAIVWADDYRGLGINEPLIETVAQALAGPPWEGMSEDRREPWRQYARAAVAAVTGYLASTGVEPELIASDPAWMDSLGGDGTPKALRKEQP